MKVIKKMNMKSEWVELVLVLLPLTLLSIFTSDAAVSGVRCKEAEREALLDFKLSFTADTQGSLSSWSAHNPDCCTQWDGVGCDYNTGHVNSIDLRYWSLESHQLRPSLLVLQHLEDLDLSGNKFTMRVPEFIGSLTNLEYLSLSYSGFYGKIPPHLGNLTRLQTLKMLVRRPSRISHDISLGLLHSDNLHWVSHLSSLQLLQLGGVNLSTTTDWVSSLKRLPSLSAFTCLSCSFPLTPHPVSSTCPHNKSTSLQSLDLSSSQISTADFLCLINGNYSLIDLALASMEQNHDDDFFKPLFQSAARSMLFPMLTSLDISGNQLSDEFMPAVQNFSAMPRLENLDISYNLMNTIPTFSSLLELDVSFNRLINVSMHCPFMQKLESLDLFHNIITTLPDLSKLSSLTWLDASSNEIHGNLNSILQHLPTTLTSLYLSSNSLNGIMSDSKFSQMSNLQSIDFSYNHLLTFNFSQSWVPPFHLMELYLRSCNVGPHFPNWVLTQKDLESLDISNSSILGVIPNAFWNGIANLQYLNVSHNKLEGTIRNLKLHSLMGFVIDLSFNNFHGPIPLFLFSGAYLDLSNNNFSSFSESHIKVLYSDIDLLGINLSNNLLSGPLPGWIFCLEGLRILNLENNMLTGDIPSSVGSSWKLTTLHLNNNRLSGELPSSIKNCTQLVILELGNNNFSGSVPFWIGDNLQQLIVLNLRLNNFTGEFSSNLCNLQRLQVLDLSGNRILGSVPGCVDNFTSMTVYQGFNITLEDDYRYPYKSSTNGPDVPFDYVSILWKGILAKESGVMLPQLNVIDLSNNCLTGKIPRGFTTLTYLKSLDLSSNNLNGSIPDKIGQIKYMEVLNLSSNKLSGEIPQSLADLTFLDTLNLSSNNLCGEIPKSTQLQSLDPSSYVGNPKLCGEPLPTLCPWDKGTVKPPPLVRDHPEEEEGHESFDFEAFYDSLGAGFACGLFGVLGILHFHAPSRHAFFHMATEFGDWIFVWTLLCKCRIKRRLCLSKEKDVAKL